MKDLYDTAPVGLWTTSIDGKLLHVNKTTLSILGVDNLEDLEVDFVSSLCEKIKEGRQISNYGFLFNRKDGKQIWVSLSAKLNPEEEVIEGTIQNISDQNNCEYNIAPHLEKISLINRNIIDRIKDYEDLNCRGVKIH
jgi:PAS domain S-box-containing protein